MYTRVPLVHRPVVVWEVVDTRQLVNLLQICAQVQYLKHYRLRHSGDSEEAQTNPNDVRAQQDITTGGGCNISGRGVHAVQSSAES